MSLWWTIISNITLSSESRSWVAGCLSFVQSQVLRHWSSAHTDINHGLRETLHHGPLPSCPVKSPHQCEKNCSYSAYIPPFTEDVCIFARKKKPEFCLSLSSGQSQKYPQHANTQFCICKNYWMFLPKKELIGKTFQDLLNYILVSFQTEDRLWIIYTLNFE